MKNREGNVYVFKLSDGTIKIGCSCDYESRLKAHRGGPYRRLYQNGELLYLIPTNATLWAERYIHRIFRQFKVRGEIFTPPENALAWLCSLPRLDQYNEPTAPEYVLSGQRQPLARPARRWRTVWHP